MTYSLKFTKQADRDWKKLNPGIREYFKKKLKERLSQPHIDAGRIGPNRYKIKRRTPGFRLVYEVDDEGCIIIVLIVAKRATVYEEMRRRY
jgi:mRNA interferase RelE/StbE